MRLGLALVRTLVGLLFVGPGSQKLFGALGGAGPDGTGMFFDSAGLRPGRRMAQLAGTSELTGGRLLGPWSLGAARGRERWGPGRALTALAAGARGSAAVLQLSRGQARGRGPVETATGGA